MPNPLQDPYYPPIWREVAEHLEHCLIGAGLPQAKALDIAIGAAEHLRHNWAGARPYFTKGVYYDAQVRAQKIKAAHAAGTSVGELAKQHGLTGARIYQIVGSLGRAMRDEVGGSQCCAARTAPLT